MVTYGRARPPDHLKWVLLINFYPFDSILSAIDASWCASYKNILYVHGHDQYYSRTHHKTSLAWSPMTAYGHQTTQSKLYQSVFIRLTRFWVQSMRRDVLHIPTYHMFMVMTNITVGRTIKRLRRLCRWWPLAARPLKVSSINQFVSVWLDFECNRCALMCFIWKHIICSCSWPILQSDAQ